MERLIARHGMNYLHSNAGGWYGWNGKRWVPKAQKQILQDALETVRHITDEIRPLLNELEAGILEEQPEIVKEYLHWARTSESKGKQHAMVDLASSFLDVNLDEFDKDLMQFNTESGTIDLRTGVISPYKKEDKITNISPAQYDTMADCPQWRQFLLDVTEGNQELIDFLQRSVGYSLTGLTKEHCLFLLYGSGRNGKSTFIETIRYLLGTYGMQSNFSTFLSKRSDDSIPNDLASLHKARFVSAVEAGEGKRFDESKIKWITGGDTVTARFLHKEFFEFLPAFKIWLGTNHKPMIVGTDEGIWRRLHLIPFTVYIPNDKVDENLTKKLKAEIDGILNWALCGLREYLANGLQVPSVVSDATREYRETQNWVTRFLNESYEETPESESYVRSEDMYSQYKRWCQDTGEFEVKFIRFLEAMKTNGWTTVRKKVGEYASGSDQVNSVFEGLRLKDARPVPPALPSTGGNRVSI
jgi:putative DNA primase/helicase